jgi:hypothetical protein
MLQVHLLGDDPIVTQLRNKLPFDFHGATFDGLPIDDYVGCSFGMYSWYQSLDAQKLVDGTVNCVIDTAAFLSKTNFPTALFDEFIQARSKTIDEFRTLVSREPIASGEQLVAKLASDVFIADTIPIRTYPLCRLDVDTRRLPRYTLPVRTVDLRLVLANSWRLGEGSW